MKLAPTTFIIALTVALVFPAPSPATVLFYEQGSVGFSYSQFPVGPYQGEFFSDGSVLDLDSFPPGGTGASMAIRSTVAGNHFLVIFGGFQNLDPSADVAVLFIRSGSPITTGTYNVDPVEFNAFFGFIDDASGLELPDHPDFADWEAWVAGLTAEHKFLSASGSIHLTTVTEQLIEGTFSGLAGDFGGGIMASFTDGTFSLDPPLVSVDESSWGSIKGLYR